MVTSLSYWFLNMAKLTKNSERRHTMLRDKHFDSRLRPSHHLSFALNFKLKNR